VDADLRAGERNGAAIVRALGRSPTAEYRARQLVLGDRPMALAAPYLLAATQDDDEIVDRGIYDSIGVRLRYSDPEVFAATEPAADRIVARLVFDMAEQLRCESLVPVELSGTRENIEAAFRSWCQRQQITGSAVGLLIYTVLHMVRSRLISPIHDELIEDQIEGTRAGISPIIGPALAGMREQRYDQAAFAVAARSLADAIDELVDARGDSDHAWGAQSPVAALLPPEWEEFAGDLQDGPGDGPVSLQPPFDEEALDALGGYSVYTREHDVELHAETLYPVDRRRFLRTLLDEQIAAQSVSAFALARRLRLIFRGFERDGFWTGEEQGLLDPTRLSQLVANPGNTAIFRQLRFRPTAPAVVSILIDNSGSMKRQRHETVAVLVDTLARALDLAGATSEILGFTTASWNGGAPRNKWRQAGEPANPGRLAALSHIVYKDADTPWKRSRLAIAALMRTAHFRESVDGEAIIWAYRRLLERPEERKFLVVISDGAPTEAATRRANGDSYLEAHWRRVVGAIERQGQVSIGGISIDEPIDAVFEAAVEMDLTGTLNLSDYRLLETLFLHR